MDLRNPETYRRFKRCHLLAMHRVAKARLWVFFRDPRAMQALRTAIERGIWSENKNPER